MLALGLYVVVGGYGLRTGLTRTTPKMYKQLYCNHPLWFLLLSSFGPPITGASLIAIASASACSWRVGTDRLVVSPHGDRTRVPV
jgi:hypothetical protein